MKKNNSISWQLFRKGTAGKTNKEEQKSLDQWLNASVRNKNYFIKAIRYYQNQDNDKLSSIKTPEQAFSQFTKAIDSQKKTKSLNIYRTMSIAASLTILLMGGWMTHSILSDKNTYQMVSELPPISAQSESTELVLSNGKRILLAQNGEQTIYDQGQHIQKENNAINYKFYSNKNESVGQYNTINVPRGTNFNVILSDGTAVWLNSLSSISYPVQFDNKTRSVKITGEAYFEVKKDASRPFIVNVNDNNITVLGTKFNINSYNKNVGTITTLVEGCVNVRNVFGKEQTIYAGQQTICNQNLDIIVKNVDTQYYTDWKDGVFRFDNEALVEILDDMARWYNYDIFYEQEALKGLKFTGELSRNNNMNDLLELLEMTRSIKFHIKGNSILVKKI